MHTGPRLTYYPSGVLLTAPYDAQLTPAMVGELKRLAAESGATVIMVSHDLDLVSHFADEIVTLKPEVIDNGVTRTIVALNGGGK